MRKPKPSAQTVAAAKALDKWYTKPEVACAVWGLIEKNIPASLLARSRFLEPSAGAGVFIDQAPARFRNRIDAFDLKPHSNAGGIRVRDFLREKSPECRGAIVVGNPPFGKKAELAMRFLARAFEQGAEAVVFILPRCARRRVSVQMLPADLHCICDANLPRSSFLFCGRSAQVWTCVQIWVRGDDGWKAKPALEDRGTEILTCSDFAIVNYQRQKQVHGVGQVRNTDSMPRFALAVSKKAAAPVPLRDRGQVEKARQSDWLLFRTRNEEVIRRLEAIDFQAIAEHATTGCPGLSEQAVIRAYVRGFRPRPMLVCHPHERFAEHGSNRRAAGRRSA